MSQQKVTSRPALVLQSTYDQIEIGLVIDGQLGTQINLNKAQASSQILLAIDQLLQAHRCKVTDLQFIAANLGPAPFTSLRVVIATVNGLCFATGVPLIGVNGLQAFVTEFAPDTGQSNVSASHPHHGPSKISDSGLVPAPHPVMVSDLAPSATTLALLNAYNQDLYYGILDPAGVFSSGWGKAEQLLPMLAQQLQVAGVMQLNLIGNGVSLCAAQIAQVFADFAVVTNSLVPQYCSLARVSQLAQQLYLDPANHSVQLQPLYLKTVQIVVNKNYASN